MLEFFKRYLKNEKGLSLVELLAVIVILGIVAAISIPAIGTIIEKQRDKAVLADAQMIISGAKLALADGACTSTTSCTGTDLLGYVEITLTASDSVTKDADGDYTIKWASGHTFKQITEGSDLSGDSGMKQSAIIDALD